MTQTIQTRTMRMESPAATAEFGAALAPLLCEGDVILMRGDIGAGKSHLARAILRARMAQVDAVEDVPSPTFTIVQTYVLGDTEFWHADLYRLTDPDEVFELGLLDAFDHAVCLVEWPDVIGDDEPQNALSITLSQGSLDDERDLEVSWSPALRVELRSFLAGYAG